MTLGPGRTPNQKAYYADDAVTIYHGDCLDVLPRFGPDFDMVFTSPPYNLGTTTGGGFGGGGLWTGGALAEGYCDHGDAMDPKSYREWQSECLTAMWSVLNSSGAIFYNHKPRVQAGESQLPTEWNPGLPLRQIVTWVRPGGMNFAPTHFVPSYEWVLLYAKPAFRLAAGGSGLSDVWHVPPERGVPDHPAPFPVGLPARAIAAVDPDSILDPFMGSGTTLRAAKDAGVFAIGIEQSEAYCEIAAKRMAQEVLAL